MKEEEVILVNSKDKILGTMPKMEAHKKGILHRAFSIFILKFIRFGGGCCGMLYPRIPVLTIEFLINKDKK